MSLGRRPDDSLMGTWRKAGSPALMLAWGSEVGKTLPGFSFIDCLVAARPSPGLAAER